MGKLFTYLAAYHLLPQRLKERKMGDEHLTYASTLHQLNVNMTRLVELSTLFNKLSYRFACLVEGIVELNSGIPASNSDHLIVRVHYYAVEWTSNTHSNSHSITVQHCSRNSNALINN